MASNFNSDSVLYTRGKWGNVLKILWKNNLNLTFYFQPTCQIEVKNNKGIFRHPEPQNIFFPQGWKEI